jgi:hypothetical protein
MINNWYSITFPQRKYPLAEANHLLKFLEEIWERTKHPADFGVFLEVDATYDAIVYFSPTAWEYCREQVEHSYDGEFCNKPINRATAVVCMVGLYPACQELLE